MVTLEITTHQTANPNATEEALARALTPYGWEVGLVRVETDRFSYRLWVWGEGDLEPEVWNVLAGLGLGWEEVGGSYCRGYCPPSSMLLVEPEEVLAGLCLECIDRVNAKGGF